MTEQYIYKLKKEYSEFRFVGFSCCHRIWKNSVVLLLLLGVFCFGFFWAGVCFLFCWKLFQNNGKVLKVPGSIHFFPFL